MYSSCKGCKTPAPTFIMWKHRYSFECFDVYFHMHNLQWHFLSFRLINELLPYEEKLDFSKKTFQPTSNQAFTMARERERIGIFLNKVTQYGVPETNTFQTDYLYEKTNLVQVCTCIRSVGIEVSFGRVWGGENTWQTPIEIETEQHENSCIRSTMYWELSGYPDVQHYVLSRTNTMPCAKIMSLC